MGKNPIKSFCFFSNKIFGVAKFRILMLLRIFSAGVGISLNSDHAFLIHQFPLEHKSYALFGPEY